MGLQHYTIASCFIAFIASVYLFWLTPGTNPTMEAQKSVPEVNREYWNSKTNFYEKEKEWSEEVAQVFTKELHHRREWLGLPEKKSGLRLLDVACGPGMLTTALFDFVDEARGIDIADRMVETYNGKAKDRGLFPEKMSAFQGNLVAEDGSEENKKLSDPQLFNFDVVGIANALHHMEDPAFAIKRLLQRVKPGGILLIIDFISGSGASHSSEVSSEQAASHAESHGSGQHSHNHDHGHGHGHGHSHGDKSGRQYGSAHHGFSEEQLRKLLVDAGCTEVEASTIEEPIKFPPSTGWPARISTIMRGRRRD